MKTIFIPLKKLFGVLAIIIGLSMITWIVYNRFIEVQPEFEEYNSQWFWVIGWVLKISSWVTFIFIGFYWLFGKKDTTTYINEDERGWDD